MPKTASVSIRLDTALDERVTRIAASLDRSRSWVIGQAVQDYLAIQDWHLQAIEEGLREADAGLLVPHEEVEAWLQSWGTPDELPMPRPVSNTKPR